MEEQGEQLVNRQGLQQGEFGLLFGRGNLGCSRSVSNMSIERVKVQMESVRVEK